MNTIEISNSLKSINSELCLGIITAEIQNTIYDENLWTEIRNLINTSKLQLPENLTELPPIKALRETYRKIGKDPARYRGSNEALLKRIQQNKGLYKINTVVDINNYLSIKSQCSCGSYDLNNLSGSISFRVGLEDESYKGIGKEQINLTGLPVLADAAGPFGSPTSDSERAMIKPESEKIMLVIFSFDGANYLEEQLSEGKNLLKHYVNAGAITEEIVKT